MSDIEYKYTTVNLGGNTLIVCPCCDARFKLPRIKMVGGYKDVEKAIVNYYSDEALLEKGFECNQIYRFSKWDSFKYKLKRLFRISTIKRHVRK